MKSILKLSSVSIMLIFSMLLSSCGGDSANNNSGEDKEAATVKAPQDEQLSAFMLGGMYFYNGFGGIDAVEAMMSQAGYTSDAELIDGYKQVFEFPFTSEQKDGVLALLANMWDIHNADELKASLQDLKTRENAHKAWDYARIVNNSAMAYAAGFMSKAEVLATIEPLLPLVRAQYQDWNAYFADFDLGRKDWNANDPDGAAFEQICKDVCKNPKSIYNVLPLK